MAVDKRSLEMHFSKNVPGRETELEVAKRLDGVLDIAFGTEHARCSIWLTNPKYDFRERFGIDRQLAVVYSKYGQIDNRAIGALRSFLKLPKYSDRADRVLALLIHGANQRSAQNECRNIDDWVLVPVTIDSLLASGADAADIIQRAVSSRLRTADLFGMSTALETDYYFFGRDDLVHDIAGRNELGRNNHGVFGLRKTGKTSVLYAVQRRLSERPILTLYLDLATPGNHQRRWWSLLERIAKKLAEQRRIKDVPGRGRYGQGDAAASFQEDMETLLERDDVEQIILLLDEVEGITPGLTTQWAEHWEEDFQPFWATIRGAHQDTKHGLTFVVAGVNPRCTTSQSFGKYANPIFQIANPHMLEPFSRNAIEDMAQSIGKLAGVSFTGGAYDLLIDTCGGHPFLTRLACSVVARAVPTAESAIHQVDRNEFENRIDQIDARFTDPIKDILMSFVWWFPEDYELLEAWASEDAELIQEYKHDHIEAIERLKRWGVIRDSKLAIPRMATFLREQGDAFKAELEPFVRSDISIEVFTEPQNMSVLTNLHLLRTSLEIKLRYLVYITLGLRHKYNSGELAKALIRDMPHIPGRNAEDIFRGFKVEDAMRRLYIRDLGEIIKANWEDFDTFFGVEKAVFGKEFIIAVRARNSETHIHEVSDTDIATFITTYDWFHRRLANLPNPSMFREIE